MSTLTVTLSDEQANRYGLQGAEQVSMYTLIDKIKTELAKEALRQCQQIAEETGLSDLSLDGINAEIKVVRAARPG